MTSAKPFRVVLASAPLPGLEETSGRLPNLALAYLTAALESAGVRGAALDCQFLRLSPNDLATEILAHDPGLVGFTVQEPALGFIQRTAATLRHLYRGPIVIGGPPVTASGGDILRTLPEVDYAVVGPGEQALVELAHQVRQGTPPHDVPGLVCRDGSGDLAKTEAAVGPGPRPVHPSHLWPEAGDATALLSTAGEGRRPVHEVVEEVAEGIAHQSRHFLFYDERFGLASPSERAWAEGFAEEVARRGLRFCFGFETGVEDVIRGSALLPALQAAGLRHAAVTLGLPREESFEALEILASRGIDTQARTVFWESGTTVEEASGRLALLERNGIDRQLASANRSPWLEVSRALRGYESFEDPRVQELWREGLAPFWRNLQTAPKLPALALHVPLLEFEGEDRLAAALRAYGETLARAEREYFAALLETALRFQNLGERRRRWKKIHDEQGPRLERCAAAHPNGAAGRLLGRSGTVWPIGPR